MRSYNHYWPLDGEIIAIEQLSPGGQVKAFVTSRMAFVNLMRDIKTLSGVVNIKAVELCDEWNEMYGLQGEQTHPSPVKSKNSIHFFTERAYARQNTDKTVHWDMVSNGPGTNPAKDVWLSTIATTFMYNQKAYGKKEEMRCKPSDVFIQLKYTSPSWDKHRKGGLYLSMDDWRAFIHSPKLKEFLEDSDPGPEVANLYLGELLTKVNSRPSQLFFWSDKLTDDLLYNPDDPQTPLKMELEPEKNVME